ncbi:MAG: glycosyltransferase family 39 protein [Chloroflexi bacterium]|nr:glycosyltransferase family 39 protein [Chloroflexota bacterium]
MAISAKEILALPDTPRSACRRRNLLALIFAFVAVAYMLATPIWEASDEAAHYPVVEHIARTGELPEQDPAVETRWRQEGSQPPLYYVLAALVVAPLDRSDFEERYTPNPHAKTGIGTATDNQNMMIHDRSAEAFPWSGTTLAVMLIRLLSIAMGTASIWLVFAVARLAVPAHPPVALLAMALTAFNPMFIFITASVNNDNLVILLGTSILVVALALWRHGWRWLHIVVLSILLGLAALTKLSGLTFGPLVGLIVVLVAWREGRSWWDVIVAGLALALGILLIAGWWYWRNLVLYDDPTGLKVMVDIAGHRPEGFGLGDLWDERKSFFYAYWGWFGGLTILGSQLFLDAMLVICVIAIVGLAVGVRSARESGNWVVLGLLGIQVAVTFISFLRWTLQTPASQGRLLFPVIAAISTLLAAGLFYLKGAIRLPSGSGVVLIAPLAAWAVFMPATTIAPVYQPSSPLSRLPDEANPVDARYGTIRLLGYDVAETPVRLQGDDSDTVSITVYWQPETRSEVPLSLFIEVYGPPIADAEPTLVGKVDSYPDGGLRRTDEWEAGLIYEDTYQILLNNKLGPYQPRFNIGWRDHERDERIVAQTREGTPVGAVTVRGGSVWRAQACERLPYESGVRFGNLATLRDYGVDGSAVAPGSTVDLHLHWQVRGETDQNWVIFVQLIDLAAPSVLYGSGDAVPLQSWYPTSAWVEGVCFHDTYNVTVEPETPPGFYRLVVGFYDPESGRRLPVDSAETPFDDAYLLEPAIQVEE